MNPPDPVTLLTALGLGHYAAAIVALLLCIGYLVTWVAPLVPPPGANAGALRVFVYNVMQKIAGNVRYAKNANVPTIPTTPSA